MLTRCLLLVNPAWQEELREKDRLLKETAAALSKAEAQVRQMQRGVAKDGRSSYATGTVAMCRVAGRQPSMAGRQTSMAGRHPW